MNLVDPTGHDPKSSYSPDDALYGTNVTPQSVRALMNRATSVQLICVHPQGDPSRPDATCSSVEPVAQGSNALKPACYDIFLKGGYCYTLATLWGTDEAPATTSSPWVVDYANAVVQQYLHHPNVRNLSNDELRNFALDLASAGVAYGAGKLFDAVLGRLGGASETIESRGGGSLSGAALANAGVDAENRVAQFLGIARNVGRGRVTIPGSGPGGFRITDFAPDVTIALRGSIVEVKDVADLSTSGQLRDLVAEAQAREVPLEIFTDATPDLTGNSAIARWVREGTVILQPIP